MFYWDKGPKCTFQGFQKKKKKIYEGYLTELNRTVLYGLAEEHQ